MHAQLGQVRGRDADLGSVGSVEQVLIRKEERLRPGGVSGQQVSTAEQGARGATTTRNNNDEEVGLVWARKLPADDRVVCFGITSVC